MKQFLQFVKAHPIKASPFLLGTVWLAFMVCSTIFETFCAVCDWPLYALAVAMIGLGLGLYHFKFKGTTIAILFLAAHGYGQDNLKIVPGFLSWDTKPDMVYSVWRSYDLTNWVMIMAPFDTSYLPIGTSEDSQFFRVKESPDVDFTVTQTGPYAWNLEAASYNLKEPCTRIVILIDDTIFDETYEISPEGGGFSFDLLPHMIPNGTHKIEFLLGAHTHEPITKEFSFITQSDVCNADRWTWIDDDLNFRFFTSTQQGRFRAILLDNEGYPWLDTNEQEISEWRSLDDGTISIYNDEIPSREDFRFVSEFRLLLWIEPAIELAADNHDHAEPIVFYLKPNYRGDDRKAIVVKQENILTEVQRAADQEQVLETLCIAGNNYFQEVLRTYDLNGHPLGLWQSLPPNLLSTPENWDLFRRTLTHSPDAPLQNASHALIVTHADDDLLGGRPFWQEPQPGANIPRNQLTAASLQFAILDGCKGGVGNAPMIAQLLNLPSAKTFSQYDNTRRRPLRFGYAWDRSLPIDDAANLRRTQYLLRIIHDLIQNDGRQFRYTALTALEEAGNFMASQPNKEDATDEFLKKPIRLVGCFDCDLGHTLIPQAKRQLMYHSQRMQNLIDSGRFMELPYSYKAPKYIRPQLQ